MVVLKQKHLILGSAWVFVSYKYKEYQLYELVNEEGYLLIGKADWSQIPRWDLAQQAYASSCLESDLQRVERNFLQTNFFCPFT